MQGSERSNKNSTSLSGRLQLTGLRILTLRQGPALTCLAARLFDEDLGHAAQTTELRSVVDAGISLDSRPSPGREVPIGCAWSKLDPNISMVQSAENGQRSDATNQLWTSRARGVLLQRKMRPHLIVV
jgi:hypothetical protein